MDSAGNSIVDSSFFGFTGGSETVGAGGYGPRAPRWAGEAAPAGGEGYQNDGGNTTPQQAARTGGMPWQQVTTHGTRGQSYRTIPGDTVAGVAADFHGPGATPTAIQEANPGVGRGMLRSGTELVIPPAAPAGPPPPGGPAGNGVGGGSASQGVTVSTRASSAHRARYYAVPGGQALDSTMTRKQRNARNDQKASGR